MLVKESPEVRRKRREAIWEYLQEEYGFQTEDEFWAAYEAQEPLDISVFVFNPEDMEVK